MFLSIKNQFRQCTELPHLKEVKRKEIGKCHFHRATFSFNETNQQTTVQSTSDPEALAHAHHRGPNSKDAPKGSHNRRD